jgi:hypothetical protein
VRVRGGRGRNHIDFESFIFGTEDCFFELGEESEGGEEEGGEVGGGSLDSFSFV